MKMKLWHVLVASAIMGLILSWLSKGCLKSSRTEGISEKQSPVPRKT
jgi:hypothetical protein